VWYVPQAITNTFSLAELEKKHHVAYDTNIEKAFIVHLPTRQVKFVKSEDGLYYFKPRYRTNTSQQVSLVNTVEENRKLYMEQEFMRAKHAR
jgi:hypothetical protein